MFYREVVAFRARNILRGVAGTVIPGRPRYRQYVVVRMLGGRIRQYWRGPYYRDGVSFDGHVSLAYVYSTATPAESAIIGCGLHHYAKELNVVRIQ